MGKKELNALFDRLALLERERAQDKTPAPVAHKTSPLDLSQTLTPSQMPPCFLLEQS